MALTTNKGQELDLKNCTGFWLIHNPENPVEYVLVWDKDYKEHLTFHDYLNLRIGRLPVGT